MTKAEQKKYDRISSRVTDGDIIEQKSWEMIRELNSFSEERLDAAALTGPGRTYTYRQMFRQWERYAEVFSALQITGKNHSRAGIVSAPAIEPVLAFYGLNMTGTSVSMIPIMDIMDDRLLDRMIAEEGITDLILCDVLLPPGTLKRILARKNALGLRNVIVLGVNLTGPFSTRELKWFSKNLKRQIRRIPGVLLMDQLLDMYEGTPIAYSRGVSEECAVILHTSGTTSGIHKPVPLSDRALNEGTARILRAERFRSLIGETTSFLGLDLSTAFTMIDMMHLPLTFGGAIVTIPLGFLNPGVGQAVSYYQINTLFGSGLFLPQLMHRHETPDLSSLKMCIAGGVYVSPDMKKRYDDYLKKCGAGIRTMIGYGLSEAGAAVILSDPERTDDVIGYPLPGVKIRIFDEEEEKYYTPEDGPRTGVLFLSTPSLSSGKIDGRVFFTLDEIDGETYLNTYDLVTLNDDGSLTSAGRANKYFINNDGMRFDAGLVETAVSAQPGIEACGFAPVYDKELHDTVPVLYVSTAGNSADSVSTVRRALGNVFLKDSRFADSNLPVQCVITEEIPFTATGKVDTHRISGDGVNGARYKVKPIRKKGRLVEILLTPDGHSTANRSKEASDGIEGIEAFPDLVRHAIAFFFPKSRPGHTSAGSRTAARASSMSGRMSRPPFRQPRQELRDPCLPMPPCFRPDPPASDFMGLPMPPCFRQDPPASGFMALPMPPCFRPDPPASGFMDLPMPPCFQPAECHPGLKTHRRFPHPDSRRAIRRTIRVLEDLLSLFQELDSME